MGWIVGEMGLEGLIYKGFRGGAWFCGAGMPNFNYADLC